MAQRQGVRSRALMIKETDGYGIDPATPVKRLIPLFGAESFKTDQPRNQATIYDGTRGSKGSWKGLIAAAGDIPISGDFRFIGLPLMCHYGVANYTRVGSLHRWVDAGDPISYGIQREHLQAPTLYRRDRGVLNSIMKMDIPAAPGQWMYTITGMGNGDEAYTDIGGSVINDGTTPTTGQFKAYNYMDGSLFKDGVQLVRRVTAFNMVSNNNLSGQDAAFSAGMKAGINPGIALEEGDLGLIYDQANGDGFYLQSINDTVVTLVCAIFNKPLSGGPTMFFRKIYPAVLLSRASVPAGGAAGLTQTAHWIAQYPTADWPAEAFGSVQGPFNVLAASQIWFKIDGGSSISSGVLTVGAARTAAQIAAEINAVGGFSAVAVASDFNGILSIKSKSTVAATSKVQIDTAGAGTIHALLGFTATIFSGYAAAPCYTELQNDISTDY